MTIKIGVLSLFFWIFGAFLEAYLGASMSTVMVGILVRYSASSGSSKLRGHL